MKYRDESVYLRMSSSEKSLLNNINIKHKLNLSQSDNIVNALIFYDLILKSRYFKFDYSIDDLINEASENYLFNKIK